MSYSDLILLIAPWHGQSFEAEQQNVCRAKEEAFGYPRGILVLCSRWNQTPCCQRSLIFLGYGTTLVEGHGHENMGQKRIEQNIGRKNLDRPIFVQNVGQKLVGNEPGNTGSESRRPRRGEPSRGGGGDGGEPLPESQHIVRSSPRGPLAGAVGPCYAPSRLGRLGPWLLLLVLQLLYV